MVGFSGILDIGKGNKYFMNCTRKDAPKEIGKTISYVKYCLSPDILFFQLS